jgi:hypothetical protein
MAGFLLLCDVLYRDVVLPTEKEANGCRAFIARDYLTELLLDLLLLWKGLRAQNLLHFVRHIMFFLRYENSAVKCPLVFVITNRRYNVRAGEVWVKTLGSAGHEL